MKTLKPKSKQESEPWYLLTNLPDRISAIRVYSQRYGIEAMFKDCKIGGYNLEDSQASPNRLISLMNVPYDSGLAFRLGQQRMLMWKKV